MKRILAPIYAKSAASDLTVLERKLSARLMFDDCGYGRDLVECKKITPLV